MARTEPITPAAWLIGRSLRAVTDLRRVLRLDVPGLTAQVREALDTLRATPGREEVAAG